MAPLKRDTFRHASVSLIRKTKILDPVVERRNPLPSRILLFFCRHRIPVLSRCIGIALGCDIYCPIPAEGPYLPHPYGIVVHSMARLGTNVTLMQQVTLGSKDGSREAPTLGNNVFCGAGCRILGKITLGAGAIVGANAVVTRDVPAGATVVGANQIICLRDSGQHHWTLGSATTPNTAEEGGHRVHDDKESSNVRCRQ
jgi:serine acetyltransferase